MGHTSRADPAVELLGACQPAQVAFGTLVLIKIDPIRSLGDVGVGHPIGHAFGAACAAVEVHEELLRLWWIGRIQRPTVVSDVPYVLEHELGAGRLCVEVLWLTPTRVLQDANERVMIYRELNFFGDKWRLQRHVHVHVGLRVCVRVQLRSERAARSGIALPLTLCETAT